MEDTTSKEMYKQILNRLLQNQESLRKNNYFLPTTTPIYSSEYSQQKKLMTLVCDSIHMDMTQLELEIGLSSFFWIIGITSFLNSVHRPVF
jgi:hypothetical protein